MVKAFAFHILVKFSSVIKQSKNIILRGTSKPKPFNQVLMALILYFSNIVHPSYTTSYNVLSSGRHDIFFYWYNLGFLFT